MTEAPALDDIRRLLRCMLRIRRFEERVAARYPEQQMRTPVHLCIGQEAVAAGVCLALGQEDVVCSTHRSHGHYLAKGGSMPALAAELYGRSTGCASGRGGSMHVIDVAAGVAGTSAIVGGGIPLAVGMALAFALRREPRVAVAFLGDGAADEGVFFESLGLASLRRLPVLFVIENNGFATASPLANRRRCPELHRLAEPHGIPGEGLDGNDALAVLDAARRAVDRARRGEGPTVLEAVTCRWKGHVGPQPDTARPAAELAAWMARCPIAQLCQRLPEGTSGELAAMEQAVAEEIDDAFAVALASPYPDPATLLDEVW
ncbi:MAG: thiamine pyrophosphate-dependent dehydrogenase E1 component subunit alpha [Desulfovibrio sp.]|jgi:pyruvate dehydrogenase E1 component alpha subunit|nr:thiamine pyrophosphate-dependent dehydrogenase E1 component subunit alpha [Desulfovibrio sp.]MCA1985833.1 thiamine pyrophosphate-dependent dehydrogenase E1 component subunit alpha [Desulfovibrio sp.]